MDTKPGPVMRECISTARRDGRWWVVQCDQWPSALSQVETLEGIEAVHAEANAYVAHIPPQLIDVRVRADQPGTNYPRSVRFGPLDPVLCLQARTPYPAANRVWGTRTRRQAPHTDDA